MSTTLPHYHWLASIEGDHVLREATAWRQAGFTDLKIGERLRANLDPERAAMVLTQIDLRARAAVKFADAGRMLFTRDGLEQSTSEQIARHRSARFAGSPHIIDLCCGIGGDLMALAALHVPLTAVDLDPVHLFLAEYNARLVDPDLHLTTVLSDVRAVDVDPLAAVFVDPARRTSGGQRIGYQSEPPVEWSIALASRATAVAIKTAPGIPHELVPEGWELEHIALGHDLKEAVMWSPELAGTFDREISVPAHRATVIARGEVHSIRGSQIDVVQTREPQPGQWLHDINPAVTNAGLVWELAEAISASLIDPQIGFLVSDRPATTPFTASYRVVHVLPWHEKKVKRALTSLDAGPVDIRRRGLAGDVPTITKRLRGTGSQRVLIAMTRVDDSPTAIICAVE